MIEKNVPIQRFREIQDRLQMYHNIVFHQPKGLCPLYYPISHDFFSLILFESAEGKHIIDGKEYIIQGTQLHMVYPGQVHHWDYQSDHGIYQLFISGDIFERLGGLMQLPVFIYKKRPVIDMERSVFHRLVHEFKYIRDELITPSPVMSEIIYSKMKIIAREIFNEIQKNEEYSKVYENHPILFDFMLLLNKNFSQERSKKYYAEQLRINSNYLNILCKKYLGRTASEIIEGQTMEKLKYKLMVDQEPLKDLAFDFNFNNYGHFSGFIKKHTGLTPKRFRSLYGVRVVK
ncbi:AraC family transcriptional regulator [Chryseobacterium sp. G0162]|uniref:AraC family transcriptional regulator n=1 Tax=Chryseobacterium sp. G0162 TaxID=2487063 RepID=UPI0013DE5D36|nr:helix-turn-helix transcriptional regulator [Chryseobacterium sp. G0162]